MAWKTASARRISQAGCIGVRSMIRGGELMMGAGSHWREEADPAVPPAGIGAMPTAAADVPNDDPFWDTWRGPAAIVALGCSVFGWIAIFSIGVPMLIAAHLLLTAALLFSSVPRSRRARMAAVLLPVMWWPFTLLALPGAGPVLLAWIAYRRFFARRGRAWDEPAWPKLIIAAAVAAGAGSAVLLGVHLFI